MKYEFIPIDENNYHLIKENDLVAFTSTMHREWRDINHEHFSATICRVYPYELTTDETVLVMMGRTIFHAIKYEKLWLLKESE